MEMTLIVDGLERKLVIQDEPLKRPVQRFEITAGCENAVRLPNLEGCDWLLLDSKGE